MNAKLATKMESRAPRKPRGKRAQAGIGERLRKAIERRVTSYLWVEGDTPAFRPALLPKIYGDGRALFALATVNLRPRYYVIQGDSSWTLDTECRSGPDFREFVDDILTDLEEHFGNARCGYSSNNLYHSKRDRIRSCDCEDCADGRFRASWPMVDADGGCSWDRMRWPEGFDVVPHVFNGDLLRHSQAADHG